MSANDARVGKHLYSKLALITKVPIITAYFWIVKVLTTGMGETTSDFLAHTIGPYLAVTLAGIGLVIILLLQFRQLRYIPWIYWTTVVMVSVFGTMAADVLHIGFKVPYLFSTTFFSVVLIIIFIIWYFAENTLSIHSINTRSRETFYWGVVLTTFALGTAAGDMTAVTFHLGYFTSGLLFAGVMCIPAIGFWKFGLNSIIGFWFAYILTRPLGASLADWAGVSHARGGLALGTGPVSLVLMVTIIIFVTYLVFTGKDSEGQNIFSDI